MTSTHEKSSISPVIAGKPLEKLREIHDHLGNAQMLDTIKDVIDFYYKNNMEQIIMDMKTAESEKLAELQNEAEKRGYDLSADAEKMVKAMIKREKKLGGIYCPCRNIVLMEEEEKKKYTCPCVDLDNDIKETGACHCGVFIKKEEKNENS